MNKILYFLSKVISYILHPIIIPTIIVMILAVCSPSLLLPIQTEFLVYFVIFIFATTWAIPALVIYGLHLMDIIKNLELDEPKERIVGILATTIVYGIVAYILFYNFRANLQIMQIFSISVLSQICSIVITYFWKISLHTIGIWGLVGYLSGLIYIHNAKELILPVLAMILLSGLLLSARLYLQKHTIEQILAGIMLSSSISVAVFCF
ncbi:MAG: hypothetical protein ACKVOU_10600 [Cytophagales bacterium]